MQERQDRFALDIMFDNSFDGDATDEDMSRASAFEEQLLSAIKLGNVDDVRQVGKTGHDSRMWLWANVWRSAVSEACEHGHEAVLIYLLDECNASSTALCPCDDPLDPEFEAQGDEPVPNPAPPLYIAAAFGKMAVVSLLLERGADINATAYDGATPFFHACYRGNLEVAQFLYERKADLYKQDQDGGAAVHAAACRGHLHILQFLARIGVNLETPGTIYVGDHWDHVLRNVTPLTIARHMGFTPLVSFLQSRTDHNAPGPASSSAGKRARSEVPMTERAQLAGVAHRLKPIPPSIQQTIQTGSEEEKAAAKKQLQKLQIANQQMVARAEQAKLKLS